MAKVKLSSGKTIGDNEPKYIIAEIGINHNGSLEMAKKMIDAAAEAKCDAVKFQKRTPEICTPKDQWQVERDTPWGRMTYIDYRRKVEFGANEYREIDSYCKQKGVDWFASPWDEPSVDFLLQFNPSIIKVASASLTDLGLLKKIKATGTPMMISTGMSTMTEIETVINIIGTDNMLIAHTTSSYPCPLNELNLNMIHTLKGKYPNCPIGYSGHEVGLATTVAAAALGAAFIERHFTLDRAMWGSDQAASVEPVGMQRLVRDIRDIEIALGDGVKKVYESELAPMKRLRREYLQA
ncbi:MAG: N-acetylneuraminate synthase family protein [Cytophagales bacterium]|nr:N-acetylneuraminate synthase family protein [Cytophagales bacterium]